MLHFRAIKRPCSSQSKNYALCFIEIICRKNLKKDFLKDNIELMDIFLSELLRLTDNQVLFFLSFCLQGLLNKSLYKLVADPWW